MAAAHVETSVDRPTTGDVKRAFGFNVSDFASIVTTTAYVDKSLMIRDVYNASPKILITAPRRFGKSTNLDMVKRFFEMEVDSRGIVKPVQTTNNYKLFKNYNLEIFKDVGFLNEHFGKYPVVYIDFKLFGSVDTSAEILDAFKIIVENSLKQHRYILQSSRTEQVFSGNRDFDLNNFRKYVSDGINKDVDGLILAKNFKHLSTILNRVFGKKVFVLIDSYDAFLDSPVFKNQTDGGKIMSLVKSSVGQLLNNISCVDRVLITGVIPVIGVGFLPNDIESCHFLERHPFTKYYGLTSAEVDTVLSKFIECDEERRDVKNTINDYYNAYETRNRDIRVYNISSVLQYVCRRTVQSYWCERRYINEFKMWFKIEPIRQNFGDMLFSNELQLDISQPLLITDILKVNSMITSGEAFSRHSVEVELFFVLLYNFGYLSVISELGRGVVCVNIPSEEIKYELAKAVFDEQRELRSSPQMDNILSAVDAFRPDASELDDDIEQFCTYMSLCYQKKNGNLAYIIGSLFLHLLIRPKYSRVIWHKLGTDGPGVVLLKNEHQVAICVTYDGYESAESVHQKVTNAGAEEHIFDVFNEVRGKVIIAVGSSGEIVYSYCFKRGDSLRRFLFGTSININASHTSLVSVQPV